MSFKIRKWHMGECNKMCIVLVSVGLLLGCAGPLQEAKEIQCVDRNGDLLYTGPYTGESWEGYLVQFDDFTGAFYPKGQCVKMPA